VVNFVFLSIRHFNYRFYFNTLQGHLYYFFWDAVVMVRRIVKHFKWEKVSILGHSRGGSIGFMYAAYYPTEVDFLICLDIAYPKLEPIGKMVDDTAKTVDRFLRYETFSEDNMPCYGYTEMIDLVESAYLGSITNDSARILMNRGMKPAKTKKGTFNFTRDIRLKVNN
ncbi:probable serine hydrolase, partial [Nilaparvata lugens]|uniref:probable serine hydrolase n=1 Tax=Nilaparvata lugens TaxID=108931 RepID=UPI00193CBB32